MNDTMSPMQSWHYIAALADEYIDLFPGAEYDRDVLAAVTFLRTNPAGTAPLRYERLAQRIYQDAVDADHKYVRSD